MLKTEREITLEKQYNQIKDNYKFFVTNLLPEGTVESISYNDIDQVLHKIKLALMSNAIEGYTDIIQVEVINKPTELSREIK